MKVTLQQSTLKSPTLLKILEWVDAVGDLLDTVECPWNDAEELAMKLEMWRHEYQSGCGNLAIRQEEVKVMTYESEVILICKELSGEYIKLTVEP